MIQMPSVLTLMAAMSAHVMWDTVEMDSPVLVCYVSKCITCTQPVGVDN